MDWGGAWDVVRGVGSAIYDVADEAYDVVRDVYTGDLGSIPDDVLEAGGAVYHAGSSAYDYMTEQDERAAAREGDMATSTSTGGAIAAGGGNGQLTGVLPAASTAGARTMCVRYRLNPATGKWEVAGKCRRRRRRRLLTASDKADLAFIIGQMGSGQLGKAAVSSLLSRRLG